MSRGVLNGLQFAIIIVSMVTKTKKKKQEKKGGSHDVTGML